MSSAREELDLLVRNLPANKVDAALREVQRIAARPAAGSWPPKWFGAIRSDRTDLSENLDDELANGFGH